MVIVRIQGGLANQMFQYVFYYWLTQKHKENNIDTYADTSMYYHKIPRQEADPFHNGYELHNIFGIEVNSAELKDVYRLSDFRYSNIRKAFVKISTRFKENKNQINDSDYLKYAPELALMDEKYFNGTWADFKYAEDYEETIRKILSFPQITDVNNCVMLNKIDNTNSVSIHVRRGDYLKVGGGIALDKSYYDAAMTLVKERIDRPTFFFFSDDIDWCKKEFAHENAFFVDWNRGEESFRDMQLMSMCKHNIVANSTFSTWASWLNTNKSKIIIKPDGNRIKVEGNDINGNG